MEVKMEQGGEAAYREVQRLSQLWVWLLVVAGSAFAWYAFVYQVIVGSEVGNRRAPDWLVVIIWLLVGLGLPLLICSSRLVVEVRGDGLYFRYYPFHRRFHRIAFEEIAKVEARTYRPILEYGGWGIRWGRGGKAYNVSGKRGVQLELTNGSRILFGSQRADELAGAIARVTGS